MPQTDYDHIPINTEGRNNDADEDIETRYAPPPQPQQFTWDTFLIARAAKIVGIMLLSVPMLAILLGQGSKICWAMTKNIPEPAIFLIAFGILFGDRNR